MRVMNDEHWAASADMPTSEQLAGFQVRLLRQARSWSQQDLADAMIAFGYDWSQATVTRLESATRPIRLNELVDLAALFDIPVAQFLEFPLAGFDQDDLAAAEREIETLTADRAELVRKRDAAAREQSIAAQRHDGLAAEVARVEARIDVLARWRQQWFPEASHAHSPTEGGRTP